MILDAVPIVGPILDSVGQPFTRAADVTRLTPTPGWKLVISRDRFTTKQQCQVVGHSMTLSNGVATFKFGHSMDTANAVFRVDNGPARPVGDVAVEAAGLGARFLTGNTSNPSGGEVHIPASALQAGQSLAIRPNVRSGVRNYSLSGLAIALVAARDHACPGYEPPTNA